jgi:exodeoxyribonuclease VII large subunit
MSIAQPKEFVFTVSQFLDVINELVSAQKFMIQGEISSISARGMNIFFTISDKLDGSLLDCYVHESKIRNLGAQLKVGLEIQVYGTAGIYKRNGKFNLTVQNINLVGEGALKQAYEQLKAELETEGYFNPSRKRKITEYPTSIGLITSANAAAKKDFLQNLTTKGIKIHFFDTRVEGLRSEDDVANAIRVMNQSSIPLDVIVLTRGGGSWESLQAFNHKTVALAVASSKIPVISAIGHEQDILISDLVADFRASTPTHAAKYLSENWNTAEALVSNFENTIFSSTRNSIRHYTDFLLGITEILTDKFEKTFSSEQRKIENIEKETLTKLDKLLSLTKDIEEQFYNNARFYEQKLNQQKLVVEEKQKQLIHSANQALRSISTQLCYKEEQVNANDPERRLKQGYSIITNAKKAIIKSSDLVELDDTINIKLYKGSLKTKIVEKK